MPSPREIPQEYRILSSMGTVTVFFAAYLGLSVEYISKETNIDPGRLIDPESYLPEEFFEKFFKMLIRKFPERNVALELARVAPMSYFGTPGKLFLRAPDAQSMLDIFVNHCDLFADRLEIRAISGSQETFFRTSQPLSDVDQGMSAEIGLGIGARITRECFGEGLLTRVQFRHRARGPVATYREFFGVPVSFGAEFNALVFSSQELKKRSNLRVGQEMRSSLEQRLQRLRQELGLDRADGLADIRRVAQKYNFMK